MTPSPSLSGADVRSMLAEMDGRPPADVPERIGSMELAWLVHRVEQHRGRPVDLDDAGLARIRTVADAVAAFAEPSATDRRAPSDG